MAKKTVAQYLIDRLASEVNHAFCLPGGASIFLIDALYNSTIKPVFNLHEQACAIAADAYGQYTNKLGLAIVTAGPGTLNALTGVAAAYFDSTPMIVLSGQANSFHLAGKNLRQKGIQEVRTEEIVRPITKAVFTIRNETAAAEIIEKAIYIAKSDRPGPVWIDIPLDIQSKLIDEDKEDIYQYTLRYKKVTIDNTQFFLRQLEKAKQPIIFVGNGVRLSGAEEQLKQVLKKIQIPILTTWRAIDLFEENHPLYVGRPGMIGQRGANTTLQTCDLLLCLGTRLDLASVAFNYKNFAPNAVKKIIVDIDQEELLKLDIDESWICYKDDVYSFLHNLNRGLDSFPYQRYNGGEWLKQCKKLHQQPIETIPPTNGTLSLYQFINNIAPYLENKLIALGSSGTVSEVFLQSFKVPSGCRIIQSGGLGSMGFGLSHAIGMHYASGRPVICFDGDGSFAMNMQELTLVTAKKLPITIFIINNNGYISIKNTQDSICSSRRLGCDIHSGLHLPNYRKIANAYDITYQKIVSNDYIHTLPFILHDYPIICEVFTDPYHKTQCRTTTIKHPDGTITTSGLENLS